MPAHDVRGLLAATGLFGGAGSALIEEIAAACQLVCVARGATLMREGDRADEAYLLLAGRLRVLTARGAADGRVAGEVAPGELVGEMALLSPGPRAATVVAIRDSDLLRIPQSAFATGVAQHPQAALEVCRILIERLRGAIAGAAEPPPPKNVAVVTSALEATAVWLVDAVVSGLAAGAASVVKLDRERVVADLGGTNVRAVEVDFATLDNAYFHDIERGHDHVVYVAPADAGAWTLRCLGQADVIVCAVPIEAEPGLGALEPVLAKLARSDAAPRIDLALVHDPGAPLPGAASAWLDRLDVTMLHQIRVGERRDVERLVRHLTNRANGLVLGGGGARGMAHLGVVRAIQEAGIPIDVVCGTSFGALVGAAVALGWDHRTILQAFREALARSRGLYDFTLPIVALVAGNELSKRLRKFAGELDIEDLRLPYYCVSSRLSRGDMLVHRRGVLWRALRASVSIPGIFPPVASDGDLLVDGGLANNFPVDLMRKTVSPSGAVYACDVTGHVPLAPATFTADGVFSGLRFLRDYLNPFARDVETPGLMSILTGCVAIAGRAYQEELVRQADVCFRPPVGACGLLEWSALEQMADAGYAHAAHVLCSKPAGSRK